LQQKVSARVIQQQLTVATAELQTLLNNATPAQIGAGEALLLHDFKTFEQIASLTVNVFVQKTKFTGPDMITNPAISRHFWISCKQT
jgi:hypothetical protein